MKTLKILGLVLGCVIIAAGINASWFPPMAFGLIIPGALIFFLSLFALTKGSKPGSAVGIIRQILKYLSIAGIVLIVALNVYLRINYARWNKEVSKETSNLSGCQFTVNPIPRFTPEAPQIFLNKMNNVPKNIMKISQCLLMPDGTLHATWSTCDHGICDARYSFYDPKVKIWSPDRVLTQVRAIASSPDIYMYPHGNALYVLVRLSDQAYTAFFGTPDIQKSPLVPIDFKFDEDPGYSDVSMAWCGANPAFFYTPNGQNFYDEIILSPDLKTVIGKKKLEYAAVSSLRGH